MRSLLSAAVAAAFFLVCTAAWAGYGLSNVVEKRIDRTETPQPPAVAPEGIQGTAPSQAPGATGEAAEPGAPAPVAPREAAPAKKAEPRYEKTVFYPYTIHISSWQSKKDALNYHLKLSREFDPVFITKIDLGATGIWYRVDYGAFSLRQQALDRMNDMKARGLLGADPFVDTVPYAIEIGVFSSRQDASAEAARLLKKGFSTYVISEGESAYRLLAGAYPDKKSAAPAVNDLAALGIPAKIAKR